MFSSMPKIPFLLVAKLLFLCVSAFAQEEIVDNQLWIDVIPHFEINERMEFYGDGSYRTSVSGEEFRKIVLRPSIRYHWAYEIDLIGEIG